MCVGGGGGREANCLGSRMIIYGTDRWRWLTIPSHDHDRSLIRTAPPRYPGPDSTSLNGSRRRAHGRAPLPPTSPQKMTAALTAQLVNSLGDF